MTAVAFGQNCTRLQHGYSHKHSEQDGPQDPGLQERLIWQRRPDYRLDQGMQRYSVRRSQRSKRVELTAKPADQ